MSRSVIAGVILGMTATTMQAATLEEVIAEGLSESPEITRAVNARNSIYQEIAQAKSGYFPKIDVEAGIGYEWTNNSTTRANDGDVELTRGEARLSLRQMLFDGFATSSEVERHKARANSADRRLEDVAENFILEASRAYVEVNRRRELLRLTKENLYNHVKIYDQIKRRSESGLGALASIEQAEGRLALAEVNVLAEENNLLDAEANYFRVLGSKAPADLEYPALADKADQEIPESLEAAKKIAFENHPTLQVAVADAEAAIAQYNAAKRNYYPRVDLEIDRTWNNDIDGVNGTNEDLTAMIRMRYNLYNGGGDKARVRETQYQIEEARSIHKNTRREVIQSLELSWNAHQILTRQVPFLEQHVLSSTSTRDSYQKQFNIGQRSLLDLLDTENEVFSSKIDLSNTQHDHLITHFRMLDGMGLLLDALELVMPEPNLGDVENFTTDVVILDPETAMEKNKAQLQDKANKGT
ncbi:TolC family outer membrane protein [Neptuniibacter sp.]|uniref:TolC family outer membrane protein n=1 Tax=Neptuniibacter sp. TaxID=1962643 RepID=UPI0026029D55|nr:TolC family outer membrane protein [Neptuniibacter sp.]MCP4596957.1 TolC family outer membrane protein [Neptuniibacter sp.]